MRGRASIPVLVLMAALVFCGAVYGLDKEHVYYGNPRKYSKPVEIDARKVFMEIPAYKEIIDKNIDEDSALYLIKLAEANKLFLKALEKYAEEAKVDLICEEGALEKAPSVTDELIKVVRQLTNQ